MIICSYCNKLIKQPQDNGTSLKINKKIFKKVYVTANTLHVREKPNTDCSIIGFLTQGAEVLPIAEKKGWYKISYGNVEGWISENWVQEEGVIEQKEVQKISLPKSKKIDFVVGRPHRVNSVKTKKLRKIINDEFGGERRKWDLQCTEYVQYMIMIHWHNINWPVKSGRNGGKWAKIFQNTNYKVSKNPTSGSALSFTKLRGYGHIAYVKKIKNDGVIKISEANWPGDGIYHERDLSKKQQEQYGAMFINFF